MNKHCYVIGPGLMISLNEILIVCKRLKEIEVIYINGAKLSAKCQSEEETISQFNKVSIDLQNNHNFILMHKNELVSAPFISTIYHEPRKKGIFCIKNIGESVVIDFKYTYFRWLYHFDTEKEAVEWIDEFVDLHKNKLMCKGV